LRAAFAVTRFRVFINNPITKQKGAKIWAAQGSKPPNHIRAVPAAVLAAGTDTANGVDRFDDVPV